MNVSENYSLRHHNTFGVDAKARLFAAFTDIDELTEVLERYADESLLILGGGSNILFTRNFDGLVLKNEIGGIDIISENEEHVYVKAGAGVNWHALVMFCLERNLAGVENLSLIPGSVGASPMQNIGAYGVEIKEVFEQLEAYHIRDRKAVTFSNSDCEFGYRDSVFKGRYKNEFVILHVVYRLNKVPHYHTGYGAVQEELDRLGKGVTIQSVAEAVMNIRRSKLPDPATLGNAGSFFKNPTVPYAQFAALQEEHPSMPGYPLPSGDVKLAAGWLVEQAGWKGFRKGDAGCHSRQALVLVNYGSATGAEIYQFSEDIQESVASRFGVELEREVNIV